MEIVKLMASKRNWKPFFFYYPPLLLWIGVVFYFSSLPGLSQTENPDFWFYFFRKGAHVVEYFILAFLFFRIFQFHKLKKKEIHLLSFLFSLAYALSDEIHQVFVPGREGKFSDAGVDLIGIILAILIYNLLSKKSGVKWKYIF